MDRDLCTPLPLIDQAACSHEDWVSVTTLADVFAREECVACGLVLVEQETLAGLAYMVKERRDPLNLQYSERGVPS